MIIVLVNMLIAIVSETYEDVKKSEAQQLLRNKAAVIDGIQGMAGARWRCCYTWLVGHQYVHVLEPKQVLGRPLAPRELQQELHARLGKVKGLLLLQQQPPSKRQGDSACEQGRPMAPAQGSGCVRRLL
jgi:hypothetical protein